MRNLKKLLAVIVAVCTIMAFSIPAFAADAAAAPTDSKICSDLGVLKGDTADGVTAAYLAKGTTRLQAAILQLRLLGKEAEAYAETSTENFADADLVTWADGKALLAYLKKNPDLGWIGTDGKFDPNGPCTAQMFYKVLLESLGYKTGTDFQYADAIKVAGEKGLTKLASLTNLTNDNVATALVEALKAKTSDGKQTFAEKLVALSIISGDAAATAGVYNPGNTTITVDSLKAVTYQRIDISLKDAIVKLDASKITIKDLAISGATLSADGKKIIVKTAAQVAGTLYTITVAGTDYTFSGLQKDTGKPEVSTVNAKTNTSVYVTFKADDLDETTAVTTANYTVDGLTITGAAFDPDDGKTVILTTAAQTAGKLYELKVTKVTDKTGNIMDDKSVKFSGHVADTIKPTVTSATSKKGVAVEVNFTETGVLDEATALNVANYTISDGITVTSAAFKIVSDKSTNKLGGTPVVVLQTSNQVNGKLYTLTVKNVKDVSGNVMDSKDVKFSGGKLDTDKIGQSQNPIAETNTSVRVYLNDEVDESTVVPANFTIDNSLTVSAVKVDKNENGTSEIIVTTSSQVGGKLYTLTIANLKDKAGNGVNTDSDDKKFSGKLADTGKPEVKGVVAGDQTTFYVVFSEKMDEASVENLANYSIDGGLGYPTAAEYNTDGKAEHSFTSDYYVKLTTNNQASKIYTVTVKNVKDLSGNVIDSVDKKFSGVGDTLSKVKIDSIVALDRSTIKITFNKAVDSTAAIAKSAYKIENTTTATRTNDIKTTTDLNDLGGNVVLKLGGDDNNELTITFNTTSDSVGPRMYDDVYKLTILDTTAFGKNGADVDTDSDANKVEFAGLSDTKADITVDSINALDNRTLEITFNANLSTAAGVNGGLPVGTSFKLYQKDDLSDAVADVITGIVDSTSFDKNVVRVALNKALAQNTVYYLDISAGSNLYDVSGLYAIKIDAGSGVEEASFGTSDVGDPVLKLDTAAMVDVNTLNVYFNKPITVASADFATLFSKITITDGTTNITDTDIKWAKVDGVKLTLFFKGSADLLTTGVPKVTFAANASEVKYKYYTTCDLSGPGTTADDRDVEFGSIDTANDQPYLLSAQAVGDSQVKITFSEGLMSSPVGVIRIVYGSNVDVASYPLTLVGSAFARGDKEVTLSVGSSVYFNKGVTYTVYINSLSAILSESGISTDSLKKDANDGGDIDNVVTFPGIH